MVDEIIIMLELSQRFQENLGHPRPTKPSPANAGCVQQTKLTT